jgi:signal transduction histidine kinase
MLQERFSGLAFHIRPRFNHAVTGQARNEWLPYTLRKKLNKAELHFLEQHRTTIEQQTRQQIARELHDSTLQALTALSYRVATLQFHSSVTPQDLETLQQDVKAAVTRLRSDISGLRSSRDESLSIRTALEHYITDLESRVPLPKIHHTLDHTAETLPKAVRRCIVSIFKEGLHNCVYHAGAKQVWLTLVHHQHWVMVRVIDNGRGFTSSTLQATLKKRHYGLVGLAEMVAPFHGHLFVHSKRGKGTALASMIPLEEARYD